MNIQLQNICVNFSHKQVLNDVNILFKEGEIHALLGDNGAGKSTTANILSGELTPSSGNIIIDGEQIKFQNTKSAINKGICYVHQHPMLAESISIKENLLLGLKDKSNLEKTAAFWLKDLSLKTLVKDIGADSKFFTALTSALLKNPKFLILDEPSALLDGNQRDFLYENLREMAKKGMNILVITHNFSEAEKYCDTIVKLENGKITDYLEQKKVNLHPAKKYNSGTLQMNFEKLTARPSNQPAIFDINFSVRQGEIIVIQGLPEDGLLTLENALTGFEANIKEGQVSVFEKDLLLYSANLKTNKYSIRNLRKGLKLNNGQTIQTGIISTDKTFRASNPEIKISQMLTIRDSDLSAKEIISRSEINILPEEKASNLSGGMLQRLILNRELYKNPQLLILCQPLQGLDVTACEITCKKIQNAAENGTMIIILSSSDFPQNFCAHQFKLTAGKLEQRL